MDRSNRHRNLVDAVSRLWARDVTTAFIMREYNICAIDRASDGTQAPLGSDGSRRGPDGNVGRLHFI